MTDHDVLDEQNDLLVGEIDRACGRVKAPRRRALPIEAGARLDQIERRLTDLLTVVALCGEESPTSALDTSSDVTAVLAEIWRSLSEMS